MKNLILIRHAKSSWETPLKDIDRPLNQRGITDAHLVATNCLKFIPSHSVIWSSSAKRTRETAIIFAQTILYPIENIVFKEVFSKTYSQSLIKISLDFYQKIIKTVKFASV